MIRLIHQLMPGPGGIGWFMGTTTMSGRQVGDCNTDFGFVSLAFMGSPC
jgi:hypothetical protein